MSLSANRPDPTDTAQMAELADLIDQALTIADALGQGAIGILLNDALIVSSGGAGRAGRPALAR